MSSAETPSASASLSLSYELLEQRNAAAADLSSGPPIDASPFSRPELENDDSLPFNKLLAWIENATRKEAVHWLYSKTQPSDPSSPHNSTTSLGVHEMRESMVRFLAQQMRDEENNALAAGFGVWKAPFGVGDVKASFVPTLVVQASSYLPESFRAQVDAVFTSLADSNNNTKTLFDAPVKEQFQRLFVEPFTKMEKGDYRPLMVIIEGVERCDEEALREVGEMIEVGLRTLPICFLVGGEWTEGVEGVMTSGEIGKVLVRTEVVV